MLPQKEKREGDKFKESSLMTSFTAVNAHEHLGRIVNSSVPLSLRWKAGAVGTLTQERTPDS